MTLIWRWSNLHIQLKHNHNSTLWIDVETTLLQCPLAHWVNIISFLTLRWWLLNLNISLRNSFRNSQKLSRQCFELNKDGMIECIKNNAFSNVETILILYIPSKTKRYPKKIKSNWAKNSSYRKYLGIGILCFPYLLGSLVYICNIYVMVIHTTITKPRVREKGQQDKSLLCDPISATHSCIVHSFTSVRQRFDVLGADYIGIFSLGWTFSPVDRAESSSQASYIKSL